MKIYYKKDTLFVNLDESIDNGVIRDMKKKVFNIIDDYDIDNIVLNIMNEVNDETLLNNFINEYKSKYDGHLTVK